MHKCKGKSQLTPEQLKARGLKIQATKDRRLRAEWNERLRKMGLGMESGRKIGSEHISYGHDFGIDGLDFDGVTVYGLGKEPRGEKRRTRKNGKKKASKASRRREP